MAKVRMIRRRSRRRGIVAVQVALTLTALLGIAAIAVDGGLMLATRRQAQSTADAAALAAASNIYLNDGLTGSASTSATSIASANGYTNDGTTSTVTVNIPPASGPFINTAGYAEVIVTWYQIRGFSSIFGSGTIPISARSVARGISASGGSPAILILDPTTSGTVLTVKGGGNSGGITATGGSIVVNATSTSAIDTSGNHADVTAPSFQLSASSYSGNLISNNITTSANPTPDPLRYLPVPSLPAAGTITNDKTNQITYMSPGSYTSADVSSLKYSPVILQQASYNGGAMGNVIYIQSGDFFSGNNTTYQTDTAMYTNTTGGIMIYNAGTSGITLGGNKNSSLTLSAPTSGTYQGIAYFQARSSTGDLNLGENGSISITGTVYAPNASVSLGGNGSATVGSQLIVKDLSTNGNGAATVNYTAGSSGQLRQLQLVE